MFFIIDDDERSKTAVVYFQCLQHWWTWQVFTSATCQSFDYHGSHYTMAVQTDSLSSGVPQVITSTVW